MLNALHDAIPPGDWLDESNRGLLQTALSSHQRNHSPHTHTLSAPALN